MIGLKISESSYRGDVVPLDLLLRDQLRQEVKSHRFFRQSSVLQRLESLIGGDQQRPGLLEEISDWQGLEVRVEGSVPRTVSRHHLHHPSSHQDQRFVYQVEDSVTERDVAQENVSSDDPPVVASVAHQGLALHPHPGLAGGDGRHHGELQPVLDWLD